MTRNLKPVSTKPLLNFADCDAGDGSSHHSGISLDLGRLVVSRMLIQANSGGGKSRALRALLEGTHGKIQQIVLDSEGEFSSLREKFDYILAGGDGDVPATVETARVLCRRLLEVKASSVINLYDLAFDERRKYVRYFLEELMQLPRDLWRPVLVVIDEVHIFMPQAGDVESSEAVIRLATQGRKRGYCLVAATQRLSKVDKDGAAELLNKMIGRTGLDVDLNRAGDELGFSKEQRGELKRLRPGEFYAYGPAISQEVVLVRTGDVVTSHPDALNGGAYVPPPAPLAIQELLSQFGDLPEQAAEEANTVEVLKAQVRELQGKLCAQPKPVEKPEPVERIVEVPVIASEQMDELRNRVNDLSGIAKDVAQIGALLQQQLAAFSQTPSSQTTVNVELPEVKMAPPASRPQALNPPKPTKTHQKSASVSAPQMRILNALRAFQALGLHDMSKSNVAVFADVSPSSSAFTNNLGTLRTNGYVHYPAPGRVGLTDKGRDAADEPSKIATLAQLHQAWFSKLSGPQVRILEVLIRIYPKGISKPALADLAGASATSSAYTNNLGSLRSLGLVDYPQPGYVVGTKLLFPDGLK